MFSAPAMMMMMFSLYPLDKLPRHCAHTAILLTVACCNCTSDYVVASKHWYGKTTLVAILVASYSYVLHKSAGLIYTRSNIRAVSVDLHLYGCAHSYDQYT